MKSGAVTVDAKVITRPSTKVVVGARLVVEVPDPRPAVPQAQEIPLSVVYEDPDLIVVDKAAGMVVHPGPGHPDGTLVNALLHHVTDLSGIGGEERPGIVHRLDRGTSGLMVVAKHDRSHRRLAEQFAAKTAGRRYLALCMGEPLPRSGTIRSRLARHPTDRLRFVSTDRDVGKQAVTHFKAMSCGQGVSVVECWLETGRTHQIRVHMSERGHTIVGDRMYAGRQLPVPAVLRGRVVADGTRPFLHAWRLRFLHPKTGEEQHFVAAPPEDFVAAMTAAGLRLRESGG